LRKSQAVAMAPAAHRKTGSHFKRRPRLDPMRRVFLTTLALTLATQCSPKPAKQNEPRRAFDASVPTTQASQPDHPDLAGRSTGECVDLYPTEFPTQGTFAPIVVSANRLSIEWRVTIQMPSPYIAAKTTKPWPMTSALERPGDLVPLARLDVYLRDASGPVWQRSLGTAFGSIDIASACGGCFSCGGSNAELSFRLGHFAHAAERSTWVFAKHSSRLHLLFTNARGRETFGCARGLERIAEFSIPEDATLTETVSVVDPKGHPTPFTCTR
jgi:hypothetical protein